MSGSIGDVEAGQLVADRYRLIEQLGRGAHGSVWRAVDESLGRVVALKHALVSDSAEDAELIGRLKREAETLAQLNHPNIVTLYDLVQSLGRWWLVMEYVPGQSLRDLGALPVHRVASVGAQLASALEAVHAREILHRDIKPSNVLVTDEGTAKLGDFGLARSVYADVTLTRTGGFGGTFGYMAPEIAYGMEPEPAADVFSLGATLFAAVEGRSPFGDSDNPMVLMRRTAQREVSAPSRAGRLTPILSAMLRPKPGRRPSTARVRAALTELADRPRSGAPAMPWKRLTGAMIGAVAVALLVWFALDRPFGAEPEPKSAVVMGDPHTVDPCALADPKSLDGFHGEVELDPDGGNFNRCDLRLVLPDGGKADVRIELENPSPEPPAGQLETVNGVGLLRLAPQDDRCERTVVLPDRYEIDVDTIEDRSGALDLCAIGDAATTSVVAVASRGELPRRPALPPAGSLFHSNVCALLGSEALNQYPGVDARNPDRGFGGWECRWTSSTTPGSMLVRFDKDNQLTLDDGRPEQIAGRQAFVDIDGYGPSTCTARVVHRAFTTDHSTQAFELLLVVVTGPQPAERRCEIATGVAASVVGKLPGG